MRDTLIHWCDRIIRYGFYALFFLVPLVFTNNTSELFELNKMWLTWEVSLFILVAWLIKMIAARELHIRRTPLDIPLSLFLLAHIVSTIFSLDPHTSFWGYYSRFNGGLLSILTYVFLYYAAVTNLTKEHVLTIIKVTLASGLVVALWGLPSHFGKDPTCLLFQGSFDVSCWTEAFKPTVRIFSTLGQPAWMSAYMNIVLPITLAFALGFVGFRKDSDGTNKQHTDTSVLSMIQSWKFIGLLLLSALFYLDLIFTSTRAGIIAFWIANSFFWGILFLKQYFPRRTFITLLLLCNGMFLLLNFGFGTTFGQLDRFTLPSLLVMKDPAPLQGTANANVTPASSGALGGTDSGKIRQIVWQGAIEVWKANPLIGSGVETFAYAYYQHRPAAHNMTSEWDYLYNKAHNEYLNYLATTGIFGLATYLAFIGIFLFLVIRHFVKKHEHHRDTILIIALTAAFISILITNFFAFSVVIINLYLFLIPVFVFLLEPSLLSKKSIVIPTSRSHDTKKPLTLWQWTGITGVSFVGLYFLLLLIRFWFADTAYALGSNLNRVQEYQTAYLKLGEAVNLRPSEPTFRDEFASNNSLIAVLLLLQPNASQSAEAKQQSQALSQQAIAVSDDIVRNHPNNISFWKSRVRLFYALAQIDPQYLPQAVAAVERVRVLAPTDAKVLYNLGALYQESDRPQDAVRILEETTRVKPDYRDAYYALGIAYSDLAVDAAGRVINQEMRENAIAQMRYILENISPEDREAKSALSSWGVRN